MNRIAAVVVAFGVMAQGAATLPDDVADGATRFMEWVLDARFSASERQHYHEILAATWGGSNQGAKDAVVSMARAYERMSGASEAERKEYHDKAQREFVRLLRQAGDADSRWLLAIHQAAQATPAPVMAPVAANGNGSLIGKWTTSHISTIQYRNSYTGVSAPTNGNHFSYEFRAGGTYSFAGLMQSVMYNCTTTVFSNETGRYSVEGNVVSLKPEQNPYRMTNSCAPSSNREAPGKLSNRSYRFHVNGNDLELTGDSGKPETFTRNR